MERGNLASRFPAAMFLRSQALRRESAGFPAFFRFPFPSLRLARRLLPYFHVRWTQPNVEGNAPEELKYGYEKEHAQKELDEFAKSLKL